MYEEKQQSKQDKHEISTADFIAKFLILGVFNVYVFAIFKLPVHLFKFILSAIEPTKSTTTQHSQIAPMAIKTGSKAAVDVEKPVEKPLEVIAFEFKGYQVQILRTMNRYEALATKGKRTLDLGSYTTSFGAAVVSEYFRAHLESKLERKPRKVKQVQSASTTADPVVQPVADVIRIPVADLPSDHIMEPDLQVEGGIPD